MQQTGQGVRGAWRQGDHSQRPAALAAPLTPVPPAQCTNRPDCGFCPGIEVGCHEGKASGPIFLASTCSNWVFAGNSAEKPPVNGYYARAWLTEELRKKWLATKDGAVKTATGSADAEEQVPGAAGASDDPDRDSTGASGPTEDGVADHSDAGTTGATGNTERDAPDGSDAGTTGATGRTKENGPAEPSATSNEGEGKRGTYHGKLAFQRVRACSAPNGLHATPPSPSSPLP